MHGAAVNIPNWVHSSEDAFFLNDQAGVGAVFDGLAAHGHSDIASALAAEHLAGQLPKADEKSGWAMRAVESCRDALNQARKTMDLPYRNMTATAVIAWLRPDGMFEVAWCGDSRAYLIHADTLIQLTHDHDFIYEQLAKNLIEPRKADFIRFALGDVETKSDAYRAAGPLGKKAFNRKHLMCSDLASGPVGFMVREIHENDTLILCTDGVHDNLTRTQMQAIASTGACSDGLAQAFASAAETRARAAEGSAHPDDITCVTLHV
jgi:serine/threonine protein phosphatase PrpC